MPLDARSAYLLKRPFGILVIEKYVTRPKILSMLKGTKKVIAVGDATTSRLISFGITPHISVIDGMERRTKHHWSALYDAKEMYCINPAGGISIEALRVLQDALRTTPPVRVTVNGEEDLLALPLFVMAPNGSVVLYGQPQEGLVVVKITKNKQIQARDLMIRICENDDLLKTIERFEKDKSQLASH